MCGFVSVLLLWARHSWYNHEAKSVGLNVCKIKHTFIHKTTILLESTIGPTSRNSDGSEGVPWGNSHKRRANGNFSLAPSKDSDP